MFLKNQVQLRDNVLFEQKMMIERNQVNSNISYEGLKQVDTVGNDVSLPQIPQSQFSRKGPTRGRQRNRGGYRGNRTFSRNRNARWGTGAGKYSAQSRINSGPYSRNSNYSGSTRQSYKSYRPLPRINSYASYNRRSRNTHELPDYLKNRIVNNHRATTSMDHKSLKNKGLSYQRRLQKAIYDRNQKFSSVNSRSTSRRNSFTSNRLAKGGYRGRPGGYNRRKMPPRGGSNYRSQPNLKLISRRVNYGQPRTNFVRKDGVATAMGERSTHSDNSLAGNALKLLRRKN